MTSPAADRWREELAGWEIPPEILAQAPESPWGFPPELFAAPPDPVDTPSRDRALERLPPGGSVIDVGCGGGAGGLALVPPAALVVGVGEAPGVLGRLASGGGGGAGGLALAPPAALVVGVDESPRMLETFDAAAAGRDCEHRTVEGRWPDVAAATGVADVVVCHHVLYNVADLGPFVRALDTAARQRVVVEITATPPVTTSGPLWKHFHGIDRPTGPAAELAFEVIRDLGID